MPDITLKYSQEELEEFIRKMLATKGLKPKNNSIRFTTNMRNGEPQTIDVIIDCDPGPMLDACPMCQTKLVNGTAVQPEFAKRPSVFNEQPNYTVDESAGVSIDPDLGETLDPPSPQRSDEENTDTTSGSMHSLLAINRQLTTQRERELAARKRQGGGSMMAGESLRPPRFDTSDTSNDD